MLPSASQAGSARTSASRAQRDVRQRTPSRCNCGTIARAFGAARQSAGRRPWNSLMPSTPRCASARTAISASANVGKSDSCRGSYAKVVPELCIMCGNCVLACQAAQSRCATICPASNAIGKRAQSYRLAGSFVCGAICKRAPSPTDSRSEKVGILCRLGDRLALSRFRPESLC